MPGFLDQLCWEIVSDLSPAACDSLSSAAFAQTGYLDQDDLFLEGAVFPALAAAMAAALTVCYAVSCAGELDLRATSISLVALSWSQAARAARKAGFRLPSSKIRLDLRKNERGGPLD